MDRISGFFGAYRFLSNFYPATLTYEGIEYPTSEHAYQAAKTLDIRKRKEVAALSSPGKAKRAGKSLILASIWNEKKEGVMLEVLRCKFQQNKDLATLLMNTGNAYLEELNTWGDTYWGVTPSGEGKNTLGVLLMKVRDELQKGYDPRTLADS